jgi:site-specific DNA-methyltransferase (adenine-specific)
MVQRALLTSQTEWGTPFSLLAALECEFRFTLDPCSTHANAKCKFHFTKQEDGLQQERLEHTVFKNPPYRRDIRAWMKKAQQSSLLGATCVCLVPARTDTRWWHAYAMKGEIRFHRGRIKFGGGRHPAPFPSAVVIFWPRGHVLGSYPSHGGLDSLDSRQKARMPSQSSTLPKKLR